jgi:hypothetical protein
MAEFEDSRSSLSSVAAGVAGVRESLARLTQAIGSLEDEAEQLRVSAAVRASEVAVLERSPVPEVTEEASAAELEDLLSLLKPTPALRPELDMSAFLSAPAPVVEREPEPVNSSEGLAFGAPEQAVAAQLVTYVHPRETPTPAEPVSDPAPSEIPDVSSWEASEGELAALDRFFSSDVEPEPSQKWLLDN